MAIFLFQENIHHIVFQVCLCIQVAILFFTLLKDFKTFYRIIRHILQQSQIISLKQLFAI
ncbi:Uncharacterised protein [Segatella copri]|nr:Uncharacterised protein [Segatella copri]